MKDYSLNLEEKKDFILGYDITSKGQIKIKFAKGKPWYVPYNQENEQKLLEKMEEQLKNAADINKKLKNRLNRNLVAFGLIGGLSFLPGCFIPSGLDVSLAVGMFSVIMVSSLIPAFSAIVDKLKLNDLAKNIEFMEIKEKLNAVVRSNQNTLMNVSNKTKKVVSRLPEDKEIFNINSFNYVPFRDLEQIMENSARNEKFGFNYNESEEVKGFVKKRVR